MTNKELKKRMRRYYLLGFLVAIILPVLYIFYVTGVFEEGIMVVGISSSVMFGIIFIAYKLIKDFHKRAMDKKNPDAKDRGIGKALFRLLPWVVALAVVQAVESGIADMYMHILVISFMQVIASIFIGFEEYYRTVYYYPDHNKKEEPAEQE